MTSAPTPALILASASPRRRRILEDLGLTFTVLVPEVEEVHYDDRPRATVAENALLKSRWCQARCPDRLSIAADTAIDFNGRCIPKPADLTEAFAFLRAFSGASHRVLTAVAFFNPAAGAAADPDVRVVESTVTFKRLADDDIRQYFSLVDPLDKAGAYDIDQHGDLIIAGYDGSYTNIVGLPVETVSNWLAIHGLAGAT